MPRVPLSAIAHGRSGDKGDHANVAIIARTDAAFAWLRTHLTTELVSAFFSPLAASRVERFEAANVRGLNFVLYNALGGGASRTTSIWVGESGLLVAGASVLLVAWIVRGPWSIRRSVLDADEPLTVRP